MFSGRTRPDSSYSLSVLSRHVANPKVFHAPLVKHFLRHLQATIDWGGNSADLLGVSLARMVELRFHLR